MKHLLLLLLATRTLAQDGIQLDCYRIPRSFCCTSRIKQQCPDLCAGVSCGPDFLQTLFSTDSGTQTKSSDSSPWPAAPAGTPDLTAGITSFVEKLKSMLPGNLLPPPPAPLAPAVPPPVPDTTFQFTPQPVGPTAFPTLVPFVDGGIAATTTFSPEWTTQTTQGENGHRHRTTPDPRIIRPPESLVIIGDYDEEESEKEVVDTRADTGVELPPQLVSSSIEEAPVGINSGDASPHRSDWKVSLVQRGSADKTSHVARSIPPFSVDGKSGAPTGIEPTGLISKFSIKPSALQKELSGETEEHQVPKVRTTVGPGITNKVSLIPFRPIHFTRPHPMAFTNGPPSVAPTTTPLPPKPMTSPPPPPRACGVAPDFAPCVSSQDASRSLLDCCKRKNLPLGCQHLCRYDITQAEIKSAMDRGQCGILHVAPFLECASQGKDNTECCRYKGLAQKTGPQCEQFCRGSGIGGLGIQHLVCGQAVQTMLQCHHSGVRL